MKNQHLCKNSKTCNEKQQKKGKTRYSMCNARLDIVQGRQLESCQLRNLLNQNIRLQITGTKY